MSYSIISTYRFEKELKRLVRKFPSLKNEFAQFVQTLEQKPNSGTFVSNNCYKIRLSIASKGKGKSGGARVITHIQVIDTKIFLLSIYDKSEQPDISDKDLDQ